MYEIAVRTAFSMMDENNSAIAFTSGDIHETGVSICLAI